MSTFRIDNPLSAPSEDTLGRGEWAARLAENLLLPPGAGCLVVSIEGPWGYGKTSTLHLIEHFLEELGEHGPILGKFNPWMIGSPEALMHEFLLQIAAHVGTQLGPSGRLVTHLRAYAAAMSLAEWIPGVGIVPKIAGAVLKAGASTAEATDELAKRDLLGQKAEVAKALQEVGRPLVIFIDDLDRLPPAEVFQMIRLIKAVSDFPRTTYVIAFDPTYLVSALEANGIPQAALYLDKIIQVRATLPRIGRPQIASLLDQVLNELELAENALGQFPEERERLSLLYHRGIRYLLQSPRDVYRVFNRLRVSLPTTWREIRFTDLFALEVLAIAAPHVFEHLRSHPEAYVGPLTEDTPIAIQPPHEAVKAHEQERQQRLAAVSTAKRTHVERLVAELFPLTKDLNDAQGPASRTGGHLAHPANLVVALAGGLPPREVSVHTARSFIRRPPERDSIVVEVIEGDQVSDFLSLVRELLENTRPEDPKAFCDAVARMANRPELLEIEENRSHGFFLFGPSIHLAGIVRDLVLDLQPTPREQLLRKIFEDPVYLPIASWLLRDAAAEHGLLEDKEAKQEADRSTTRSFFDELLELWVGTARQLLEDGPGWTLLGRQLTFDLLVHFRPEVAKELAKTQLASEPALLLLNLAGGGAHNDRRYVRLGNNDLNRALDLKDCERLRAAAQRLKVDTSAPPRVRAIAVSLLNDGDREYVERWEPGGED